LESCELWYASGRSILEIDPENAATIYAGLANGYGVFKSTDAAANWNPASSGLPAFPATPVSLAIDPQNSDTVYVGTGVGGNFKQQYWPNESPLGKRIETLGRENALWQMIIGVVADVRERGLEENRKPGVYLPLQQVPNGFNIPKQLAIRASTDPSVSRPPLGRQFGPSIVISRSLKSAPWTTSSISQWPITNGKPGSWARSQSWRSCSPRSALRSPVLRRHAAQARDRRTIALGAGTADVRRMVVTHGLGLAVLGMAIGAGANLAVTRSMTKLSWALGQLIGLSTQPWSCYRWGSV
jgi:hypothetical protein